MQPENENALLTYGKYLLGEPTERGAVIFHGPYLYITKENFETEGLEISSPFGRIVHATDSDEKAERTVKEFLGGRRLPVDVAAAISVKGFFVFPKEKWEPRGEFEEFRIETDLTALVMTAEETAGKYELTAKKVEADCENGVFSKKEARKSKDTWLITKEGTDRIYGENKEEKYPVTPLMFVFTTGEAAEIWNRDKGDVRSAAAGAGHRAARLFDGERRKSGRTWLVTRKAMEKLYGPAVPEKMRAAMNSLKE